MRGIQLKQHPMCGFTHSRCTGAENEPSGEPICAIGSVGTLHTVDAARVVIVSHTAEVGGGETALLRLVDAMGDTRFDISVITFEEGELNELLKRRGIPVETIALGTLNSVSRHEATALASRGNALQAVGFVPRLARAIRRQHPDLLVANTLKAALAVSAVAPLVATPWVWHLHDRLSTDYLGSRTSAVLRTIAQRLPRCVIVNSASTLATLGRIDSRRAKIAYPGLGAAAFEPADASGTVIGILGRISETKGQLEFARAAAEVLRSHPDARFSVIGSAMFRDGAYEDQLREFVGSAHFGGRLELAGWSHEPGVALRRLSMLVHASPVPEPFGQVIVEAMAAGVPVIATDAGGVPEIVDPKNSAVEIADGVARAEFGLLVRPRDSRSLASAIKWALDRPEDMTSMAARARTSAMTRFTIEGTCDVVEQAWTDSLPRRARRPTIDPAR